MWEDEPQAGVRGGVATEIPKRGRKGFSQLELAALLQVQSTLRCGKLLPLPIAMVDARCDVVVRLLVAHHEVFLARVQADDVAASVLVTCEVEHCG